MRTIYTKSSIDKDVKTYLWESAILIFDTCALLDFYSMTKENQEIIADILKTLSARIWLPAHVYYEFTKNQNNARMKPISEKYTDRDLQNNKLIDDLNSYINQWERKYYHPFVTDDNLKKIKDIVADITPKIAEIKKLVAKEYKDRKSEIKQLASDDKLGTCIDDLPKGAPFSYSEIKQIVKEGTYRYKNEIPPGYKDALTKSGIRQYGDLIIWKEIIRFARENKKDVIFISNDVKADWVIVDESDKCREHEKPLKEELGNPRRELLAEFEEETERKIWFCQTSKFIEYIEKTYQPDEPILEFHGKLGAAKDVLLRKTEERQIKREHLEDTLLVRCATCGRLFELNPDEFNFDWENSYTEDRGMGCEIEYESDETYECPNCGRQIDFTLHIWEYPIGVVNSQNIEIDGGDIESSIDLSPYFEVDGTDICAHCGEQAILNDSGLCHNCEEEYNTLVESDEN